MTRRGRRSRVALLTLLTTTPAALAQDTTLDRAREAQRQRQFSEAADHFLELIDQEPGEVEWVIEATDCLLRCGRFNDSLDVLDRAGKRFPNEASIPTRIARTHKLKAESMAARGAPDINVRFQLEEAARIADAVLRLHPWEREPRLILAISNLQLGHMELALAEAEEIVRRFPQDQAGFVILGDVHYQDFVRLSQQRIAEKPRGDALVRLLELIKASRDGALKAYERAGAIDENRAFPHVQMGNIFGWIPNLERALQEYTIALSIDPGCAVNHRWIGQRFGIDRRIELYRKAAAAYRDRSDAIAEKAAILDWYLAYAFYEKKKFGEAYRLFTTAVDANPAYLNSRCYAMLAAYWNDDAAGAELQASLYAEQAPTHFADTVRATPNEAEVTAILEFLVRRSHDGQRKDRSRSISHVLAKLLDTERHWNNYAFLCRQTGKFEESLSAYRTALTIAPDSPQLLNDTGVVLQYHLPSEENLRQARIYYERAIAGAERILAGTTASTEERDRARQAKQDATANLQKLGKKSGGGDQALRTSSPRLEMRS